MIVNVTKRSGNLVPFDADKLNQWATWASENCDVHWNEVLFKAIKTVHEGVTTKELQQALINACLSYRTHGHTKMAARLMLGEIYKEVFGTVTPPHLKDFYNKMVNQGYWVEMDYTSEEFDTLNNAILHSLDYTYSYATLKQFYDKYGIRAYDKLLESPQMAFMGIAMRNMQNEDKALRINEVINTYKELAHNKINLPTPTVVLERTPQLVGPSCFTGDTFVTTDKGLRKISEIEVSDKVLTKGNTFEEVYHTNVKPYNDKTIKFSTVLTSKHLMEATEDHLFWGFKTTRTTRIDETKFEWIKADCLRQGDFVQIPVDMVVSDEDYNIWDVVSETSYMEDFTLENGFITKNESKYSKKIMNPIIQNSSIMTEDMFRLFGYYLAEGCVCYPSVSENQKHTIFTFNIKEKEYITDVVGILERLGARVSVHSNTVDNSTKISTYSKPITALFDRLFGTGFDKKKLPELVKRAPKNLQLQLLNGAIRGDGTTIITGFLLRLSNINLVTELRDVALRCGLVSSFKAYPNAKNRSPFASLYVHCVNTEFANMVGKDLHKMSNTKKVGSKNIVWGESGIYARIRELESFDYSGNVYDISVKNDPSFCAGGIAVHNCCVISGNDAAESLSVVSHIAYTMTTKGAGIGVEINTRAPKEPVKGGKIEHGGKHAYYSMYDKAVKAAKQQVRGGSATITFHCLDPEIEQLLTLKQVRTEPTYRIDTMDYSFAVKNLFLRKVARNEEWMTISEFFAPKLWKLSFENDEKAFEEEYERVLASNTPFKKMVVARDVFTGWVRARGDNGRVYITFLDNMNSHTPFLDAIRLSNLCVAPETVILTDVGYVTISDVVDQKVNVWNGEEWSEVVVVKTADNQEMLEVTVVDINTTEISIVTVTTHHKWYDSNSKEIRTKDLKVGDILLPWITPDGQQVNHKVVNIAIKNNSDTYCFTENKKGMGVFNGILTGQCQEISIPTNGYDDMQDLYKMLDEITGEVGLCSLGAIVVSNIEDDAEYETTAYYTAKVIDNTLENAVYPFPHIEYTAKARRSIGVGMTDVAHLIAREGLKYDTEEGRNFIHRLAERHAYYMLKASVRLAKERGRCDWFHKTKYANDIPWLPIDTYSKEVDKYHTEKLHYDWEGLREDIKKYGVRFSVETAVMPNESSSVLTNTTNSVYPIRQKEVWKASPKGMVYFRAPDMDTIEYQYAFDIKDTDMVKVYSIIQKFTTQGISADFYTKLDGDETKLSMRDMLQRVIMASKSGMKTFYYENYKTKSDIEKEEVQEVIIDSEGDGCTNCKL